MVCENHKRTYGIELEGYTDRNIRGDYVRGFKLIEDGSLEDDSEREDCDDCNGEGTVECDCSCCDGCGEMECEDCCGSCEVPCSNCDCTGKVECEYCDGHGYYEDGDESVDCLHCLGSGEIECETCEQSGYVPCETCEGSGNVTCVSCGGDRTFTETCDNCSGRGYFPESVDKYGVECVSGICEEGNYEPLDVIFNYIEGYSWSVNEDCGTHVHIGASDLSAEELSRLYILTNLVEPMIYGTLPSDRINGTYAKMTSPLTVDYLINRGNQVTMQQVADIYYGYVVNIDGYFQKYDSSRYYGLNFNSYFFRKTVEFRYFEGCDDIDMAKAWIDMCIKIVDFAKYSTFEQLMTIGRELYLTHGVSNYIDKVKELIGVEYDFPNENFYSYDLSKNNIAGSFRSDSVITRAV
jgi:hypothetical protein